MSNAIAGHGAEIAMELDPTGAAGVFTVIGELGGDFNFPELSRAQSEATPHEEDIDTFVSGVLRRSQVSGTVNYIYNNGSHDELTGLIYAIVNKEKRGFRFRGPGGSADTDEWIASGEVATFGPITHPVREGVRTADFALQLSGAMKINGVAVT